MSGLSPTYPSSVTSLDALLGRTKKGVDTYREDIVLNTISPVQLFKLATLAGSASLNTVQDSFLLPGRCKISKIAVYFDAIASLNGSVLFNIQLGNKTNTSPVQTSQTATVVRGNTNDTYATTVGATTVTYTQVGGDTTATILAASIVAAINANATIAASWYAFNVAGVITVASISSGTTLNGTAFNAVYAAGGGGAGSYTRTGATLAGGVIGTAPVLPGNDNSSVPPVAYNFQGQPVGSGGTGTGAATYAAGGGGICSNPAVFGNSMFATSTNTDVPLSTANCPTMATSGNVGFGFNLIPNSPDAVWENAGVLTLRLRTPLLADGTAAITGLLVSAYIEPCAMDSTYPDQNFPPQSVPLPGITY